MKPFELNDQTWDKDMILDLRDKIITFRDDDLRDGKFNRAVILSLVVGVLHHMADEMELVS